MNNSISSNRKFLYELECGQNLQHVHKAWRQSMIASGLQCPRNESFVPAFPRKLDVYAERVNPVLVQHFWGGGGLMTIYLPFWMKIKRYLTGYSVCRIFTPTKRMSESLRNAKAFEPERFSLNPDYVGIYRDARIEHVPIYEFRPRLKSKIRSVCPVCKSITYMVDMTNVYVLERELPSSPCFLTGQTRLLMTSEFADKNKVHSFLPVKSFKVPIFSSHPRLKADPKSESISRK